MNGLLEQIKLDETNQQRLVEEVVDELSKRLIERLEKMNEDVAKGYVPLLKKYVWNVMGIDPDELKGREDKIRAYYKAVYDRSKGDVSIAYDATDKWAKEIFKT